MRIESQFLVQVNQYNLFVSKMYQSFASQVTDEGLWMKGTDKRECKHGPSGE